MFLDIILFPEYSSDRIKAIEVKIKAREQNFSGSSEDVNKVLSEIG